MLRHQAEEFTVLHRQVERALPLVSPAYDSGATKAEIRAQFTELLSGEAFAPLGCGVVDLDEGR